MIKPFKIKCILDYVMPIDLDNDKKPKKGDEYKVTDIKKIKIKNRDSEFIVFKIKEFESNEYLKWFTSSSFEFNKSKINTLVKDLEPEII